MEKCKSTPTCWCTFAMILAGGCTVCILAHAGAFHPGSAHSVFPGKITRIFWGGDIATGLGAAGCAGKAIQTLQKLEDKERKLEETRELEEARELEKARALDKTILEKERALEKLDRETARTLDKATLGQEELTKGEQTPKDHEYVSPPLKVDAPIPTIQDIGHLNLDQLTAKADSLHMPVPVLITRMRHEHGYSKGFGKEILEFHQAHEKQRLSKLAEKQRIRDSAKSGFDNIMKQIRREEAEKLSAGERERKAARRKEKQQQKKDKYQRRADSMLLKAEKLSAKANKLGVAVIKFRLKKEHTEAENAFREGKELRARAETLRERAKKYIGGKPRKKLTERTKCFNLGDLS